MFPPWLCNFKVRNKREIRQNNCWRMLTIKEKRKNTNTQKKSIQMPQLLYVDAQKSCFPCGVNNQPIGSFDFFIYFCYFCFCFVFLLKQTNKKVIQKYPKISFFFFSFHFLSQRFDWLNLPSLKTNGTGNITLQLLSFFPLLKKKINDNYKY